MFQNLHAHSEYSVLDGKSKVKEAVARAAELKQIALGITDHGNCFGHVEHFDECCKKGIKPILGNEFYIVESLKDEAGKQVRPEAHVTVLAMNNVGLRTLYKLTARAATQFYHKPRISVSDLLELHEGLCVTSGCMASLVCSKILDGKDDEAVALIKRFTDVYGSRFYIELQDGGIPVQKSLTQKLRDIAQARNLPVMVSNDSHYVNREDAYAHSVLLAVNTRCKMADKPTFEGGKRFAFSTTEFYMKSHEEMVADGWTTKELEGTLDIANACNVTLDKKLKMPRFPYVDDGMSSLGYLRDMLWKYWKTKPYANDPVYIDRIKMELADVEFGNLADYFLTIHYITNWCSKNGVSIGNGRGSAGGSLISYTLGLTKVDPIRYGLYWERFWNRGRGAGKMCDFDLDVSQTNRHKVVEEVKRAFGEGKVLSVVSFNRMVVKGAIKDCGRALASSDELLEKLSNSVPFKCDTIEEAMENSKDFKAAMEEDPKLLEVCRRLQNTTRNTSVHPCAMIITDHSFMDGNFPVHWDAKAGNAITGWDGDTMSSMGFMKIDVLGLAAIDKLDEMIKVSNAAV